MGYVSDFDTPLPPNLHSQQCFAGVLYDPIMLGNKMWLHYVDNIPKSFVSSVARLLKVKRSFQAIYLLPPHNLTENCN